MKSATSRLVALVLTAGLVVPLPALAGATATPGAPADKQAAPKDIGPVKPTKPQYDTGLKPKDEITPAEQLVFLDEHLSNLKSATTLTYGFVKQGNMEKGFSDMVEENVAVDGKGKTVKAKFLSGLNSKEFSPIEGANSNPVILHFLERDLSEMQRLTTGQPNYFRKRIRAALAEGPEIKSVKFNWNGKQVDAKSVSVEPYMSDPMVHDPARAAYKRYRGKRYTFVLSDAVPGKVAEMRFTIPDLALAGEAAYEKPLLEEVLTLQSSKK
ncbi:MAG: hypothetical protein EBS23_04015 [Betaproteobacteria bacterium]|nr:hypothetical protein [Betaproteobacteria bacterium]